MFPRCPRKVAQAAQSCPLGSAAERVAGAGDRLQQAAQLQCEIRGQRHHRCARRAGVDGHPARGEPRDNPGIDPASPPGKARHAQDDIDTKVLPMFPV